MTWLEVVGTLGPIFSIAKFIGRKNAAALEAALLNAQRLARTSLLSLIPAFLLSGFLLVLISTVDLGRIWIQHGVTTLLAPLLGWSSAERPPLLLQVAWFVVGLVVFRVVIELEFRIASFTARRLAVVWVQSWRLPSAWSLDLFLGDYHVGKILFATLLSGFAPLWYGLGLVIGVGFTFTLLPFRGAEYLRVKINPEGSYLDMIAWLLSILAMVVKLTK